MAIALNAPVSNETFAETSDTFVMPTSFAQQRLWFLDRLEPGNPVYNVPLSLRLYGELNVAALEHALNEIVRRHEILRTSFALENGEPVQVIHPFAPFPLRVTALNDADENVLRAHTRAELQQAFDLEHAPLFRVELLRLTQTEFVLLLTVHHIVFDGWSRDIFFQELAALYDAHVNKRASALPELSLQYADFCVWQREWLQGETLARELAYWKAQLADAPPLLELPTDFPRPLEQSYRGARAAFSIAPATLHALETLSRSANATLFITLLAAFETLVYRLTGQSDMLVGAPVANRTRRELEPLLGFFVNTLVMRARLHEALPFRSLLAQTRHTALDAYAHQDVPFEKLVEALQPARSLAHAPLVQVAINYLQTHAPMLQLGNVRAEWASGENQTTKFDLALNLARSADGLRGTLEYNTDLFTRATIQRVLDAFQTLLENIAAAPDTPIGKLELLTSGGRKQILVEWNATAQTFPQHCLHELFEQQVARTPQAIAILDDAVQITFAELNARANQLARHLQSMGVAAETIVGVMMERSPELVITLLAILKAGGAYLPLDPALPRERLREMASQAQPHSIVARAAQLKEIFGAPTRVVCWEEIQSSLTRTSSENLNVRVSPESAAYILYTSGSTGKPKAIVGLHRGMANRLAWMWEKFPYAADEVCCQKTALHFGDSVAEIFSPLLQGIPLAPLADDDVQDPNRLIEKLAAQRVTRLTLVPSLLRALLHAPRDWRALARLKLWTCSGEALDANLAREFFAVMPHARLLNLYGSSEVSADSTWFEMSRAWQDARVPIAGLAQSRIHHVERASPDAECAASIARRRADSSSIEDFMPALVPIGRPISNTQIYILNEMLEPAPIGVAGELYIGGEGLARGYLHQPDLTADKFIPNPFADETTRGTRLYRTGDRARYLADGAIEHLGRADAQVKVRGMRVELGEIENALRVHPRVQDAAVVLHTFGEHDARLVAFVAAAEQDFSEHALREHVQQRLPAYMMPAHWIRVETLPRTASGKVDRRALDTPNIVRAENFTLIAPRDDTEARLQTIWQRVLKLERVGVTDDFFELGGHSLLAIVLFGELEREFGIKLPIATLFHAPTIEKLARAMQLRARPREWSPLVAIQPRGAKPPFFVVHGFGGGIVGYAPLARGLGNDQPVYGLQARGQEQEVEPDATIEAMATRYIAALREIQPHGPYFLGGYCYGGTVAFEVAQQLRAQGEQIAFLGMFENTAPKSGYRRFRVNARTTRRFLKNLPYWASDFWELDWKQKWRRVEREVKQRAYYYRMRAAPLAREIPQVDLRDVLDDVAPVPLQHQRVIQVHIAAMIRYQPQRYAGRITVFRTRRQPLFCSHDPYLGWREIASEVEVRLVAGSHHTLLQEPHVESLARELKKCLDAAQTT